MAQHIPTSREQVRCIIEEAVDTGLLGIADEGDIDNITDKIMALPILNAHDTLLKTCEHALRLVNSMPFDLAWHDKELSLKKALEATISKAE